MTYADELDRQIAFNQAMQLYGGRNSISMADRWRLIRRQLEQANERMSQKYSRVNVYPPRDESGWTVADWWKR